ncbi:diaminopropionate ammonia-lyase [Chakrabartyella piscis]|uniref:diaminopropionate ammonia-lyase n=1 Tax=Chakrabartyella piscis TaxID=2918914 RepID=UPI002958798A|nr:diaminopropionate ammonia-lyase [Chakrabartyella piscis]
MDTIKLVQLEAKDWSKRYALQDFEMNHAKQVKAYHQSFPQYTETPLVEMTRTANHLGIANLYVKDESYRFGLNAFKVLGGSYAIGQYIAKKLGKSIAELTFGEITSPETKKLLGDLTFVTATDGNHGRGVAWTANQLGQKSVVYMPKGSAIERLENIQKEGAEAYITELNYDDAVRLANEKAESEGWIMVQDTAWDGYEEIPIWIMQGYATMALEAVEQITSKGLQPPTHVFLQAGVGSMASGVTALLAQYYKESMPVITIVEPNEAACLYETAKADDGDIHVVTGDMNTIMAGLACGEPCTIGMPILRDYATNYISCPDTIAADGMRVLASPTKGDMPVVSGESGAVTTGIVAQIMKNSELLDMKEKLGLTEKSVVLVFSTEGDTDQKNYEDVVWFGKYGK